MVVNEDKVKLIARELDDKERVISDDKYSSKNIETWAIWAGRIIGAGLIGYAGTVLAKLTKLL